LLAIVHLRQFLSGEQLADARGIERQLQRSVIFQIAFVLSTQICLIALGKAEQKHRTIAGAIRNHGAKSTASAFSRTRHPLLDEPVTEIGVDQAAFCPANCLT
jgi:preprotein translocase subunit SecG